MGAYIIKRQSCLILTFLSLLLLKTFFKAAFGADKSDSSTLPADKLLIPEAAFATPSDQVDNGYRLSFTVRQKEEKI